MSNGISVHIGLNRVDPQQYEGWDGALAGCEFDAKDMAALAKKQGFATRPLLLTKAATAEAVKSEIAAAARALSAGDIFFLTYSGHGGQVKDRNHEEADGCDETWVLHDRMLIDDELYALWGGFRKGVRIVVLSDSCHSGSVLRTAPAWVDGRPAQRFLPQARGEEVYRAHKRQYDAVKATTKGAEKSKLKASVLLISGCMDNQTSSDGDRNGLFTETLKKVWNGGKFKGNYRRFRDRIAARMPDIQTPNYLFIGAPDRTFEAQSPFSL